jgi:hypothetical protein
MSKGGGAATHDKLAQAAFALATLFAFQLFKAVSGPFMVGVWREVVPFPETAG